MIKNYNSQFNIDGHILASVLYYCEDSIIITAKELDLPGPVIVYVNPAFTRMTGYGTQEVIGKNPRILQGPNTDKGVLKRLRQTLEEGKVFYGEAINYKKDGSEFYNEWHIEPIRGGNDEIIYYVALQRDITQKKHAALAIEQKNAALKEIIEQIEIEKKKIKEDVFLNVEEVLLPVLKKIRRKGVALDKKYIDILEQNLKSLTSSFGRNVSEKKFKLSPREVEIANLIKSGVSSKEICALLSISFKTVETHRNKIRKKLDIINKDINLTTYLKAL